MTCIAAVLGAQKSQRLLNSLDTEALVDASLNTLGLSSDAKEKFNETIGEFRQEVFFRNSVITTDLYKYLIGSMNARDNIEFYNKRFKGYEFTVYLYEKLMSNNKIAKDDFEIEIPTENSSMDVKVNLNDSIQVKAFNPDTKRRITKKIDNGEYYFELKSGYLREHVINQVEEYKRHLKQENKYREGCIKVVTISKYFDEDEIKIIKKLNKLGVEVIEMDIDKDGLADRAKKLQNNLQSSLRIFGNVNYNSMRPNNPNGLH